jgi:predicted nucleic acid-binding Zn ribbon protein
MSKSARSDDTAGTDPAETPAPDLAATMLAEARARAGAPRSPAGGRVASRKRRRADPMSSGSGPDDRDPQLLAQTVENLVDERGWHTHRAVGGVEGRWHQIVGAELADHCLPESFDNGVLVVRAQSTAWATQVRLLAGTVLARLNEDLGAGTVTRLEVKGPDSPTWKKGLFTVKGRGPRDTYG